MSEPKKIILIRERFWESAMKDATTFGALCASIGIGIWLNSTVLQVIAGAMWAFFLLGKVMGATKREQYTLDEAAMKIEEWRAGE